MPYLQCRLLNGAAIREPYRPGQSRFESNIHGIQPGRRDFSGLSAGEKRDSRHRGGNGAQQALHRRVGHFIDRLLRGTTCTRQNHVGFQDHSSQSHPLRVEFAKDGAQYSLRHFAAGFKRVRAFHEHFRLDDGDEPGLLAERRISRQRQTPLAIWRSVRPSSRTRQDAREGHRVPR